jgi:hypothetical protein
MRHVFSSTIFHGTSLHSYFLIAFHVHPHTFTYGGVESSSCFLSQCMCLEECFFGLKFGLCSFIKLSEKFDYKYFAEKFFWYHWEPCQRLLCSVLSLLY